jgi:two-component system, chemotaxis family, chemotaxis protein CheY
VVGTVDNAADAVATFRDLRPDLVTLDIQMPEVLGVDTMALFTVIRAEDPNCEVIVITGTAFPAYREKFVRAGVLGFFLKPLNFDQLASDLRKYYPELTEQPSRNPLTPPADSLLSVTLARRSSHHPPAQNRPIMGSACRRRGQSNPLRLCARPDLVSLVRAIFLPCLP